MGSRREAILQNAFLLVARVLIAALFVPAGLATLSNLGGSASYFAGLGLPLPMAVAVLTGLFELVAGLCVLAGFQGRLTCLLLAAFALSAGFIGHFGRGDDAMLIFLHEQMFWKDVAIAGGLIALAVAGPGGYSVDARRQG